MTSINTFSAEEDAHRKDMLEIYCFLTLLVTCTVRNGAVKCMEQTVIIILVSIYKLHAYFFLLGENTLIF